MHKQLTTGLAALLVLLLVAGGVDALGGGPAVDWWVISGGGAPSNGTGVTLNDTLGQPIIGPGSGSGDITLNAGYRAACITAAAVMPVVTVALDDPNVANVVLSWGTNPANAQYQVWVSTDPYFDPDSVTPILWPASPYRHTGAAADLENHFYVVRGLNPCAAASGNSGRTGEFTFGLTPGMP